MQLGFVSAILPDLSLEDVFKTTAEFGYDCVELMCWPVGKAERRYAGVTHVDVLNFDANHVNDLAAKHEVAISSLGYYPNPLAPDASESDTALEHIRHVISASAALGINRTTTFIGRDWTKSVDDNWPGFLEVWKPLIQLADDSGVNIGIENCPMSFNIDEWPGGKNLATTPEIWRRMFNDIPNTNFGLNYDPSHMVLQHMDYLAPMKEFADRIFHVHAKDIRIDLDRLNDVGTMAFPNQYHTPKLPGMGDVNWGRFVATLGDTGYDGPICVEVEDRAFEDTLDARRLALKQSVTYLRNYIPTI